MRPLQLTCGYCGREFGLADQRAAWSHEHHAERTRDAFARFGSRLSMIAVEFADRMTPALNRLGAAVRAFTEAWKESI